ncbi:thioesterase domain-containing protein [Streptosporangium sp. NPDC005286]|uniref:thioesterase domain-containing protein n=1 Tax=Streptosporangium sp. NPDC005286 TaxID=3154463 RepID=UPI0033A05C36
MSTADDVSTAWVRRYHPVVGAGKRLVCFPHAGGSASFFRPVSARFSPGADAVLIVRRARCAMRRRSSR